MKNDKTDVHKTDVPVNSLTHQYLPADYTDAFACEITGAKKLSADKVMIDFWTVMPGWVNALFKLRNVLVRPFGMETGDNKDHSEELKKMIREGQASNGLMSVVAKSGNETVILLNDKHLDAYISVFVTESHHSQTATAITLVHYHNRLGRIYFFFIRPFHKIIVKDMLKSTIKRMSI